MQHFGKFRVWDKVRALELVGKHPLKRPSLRVLCLGQPAPGEAYRSGVEPLDVLSELVRNSAAQRYALWESGCVRKCDALVRTALHPEACMYATLSYDVNSGPEPVDDVRQAILAVFADRVRCDLLSDTFICEIETTSDYLALVRKLRKVGTDFPDQFLFVFTLHNTGSPLRSNGAFSKSAANDIIDPGDDE